MKEIKLSKANKYLKNAEIIRSISDTAGVDLFVACKMYDQMSGGADIAACEDFCHECNRLGTLDAVITTHAIQ